MLLVELGELGLIERLARRVACQSPSVLLGIGDDAAVVRTSAGKLTLLTVDSFVENVHFDLRFCSFYDVGWKAVAATVSDVAAMGGKPLWALVSLSVPTAASVESLDELYDGIGAAAQHYGVSVVGGDTTRSTSGIVIAMTAGGEADEGRWVGRAGARPGDAICVTGSLGSSEAGLQLLKRSPAGNSSSQPSDSDFPDLVSRHRRPVARVEEATLLLKGARITSMIDISDGLATDLHHICRASRVGARIWTGSIPLHSDLSRVASATGRSPIDFALYGGEDFELLFTLPQEEVEPASRAVEQETGTRVTAIGEVTPADSGVLLVEPEGAKTPLLPKGFDHFREH